MGSWCRRGSRPWPRGPRAPWDSCPAARPGVPGVRWHHLRRTGGHLRLRAAPAAWPPAGGPGLRPAPSGTLLDLEQGDLGVFRVALFGGRLAHLVDDLGKRTGQLEPLGTAVQLVAQRLAWPASSTGKAGSPHRRRCSLYSAHRRVRVDHRWTSSSPLMRPKVRSSSTTTAMVLSMTSSPTR